MEELQLLNYDISWAPDGRSSFAALKRLEIFPKMLADDDLKGHRLKASRGHIDESKIFAEALDTLDAQFCVVINA